MFLPLVPALGWLSGGKLGVFCVERLACQTGTQGWSDADRNKRGAHVDPSC
eukprot:SAG31_NODE_25440_length_461_cov_0.994475_1_plen_50_part_01